MHFNSINIKFIYGFNLGAVFATAAKMIFHSKEKDKNNRKSLVFVQDKCNYVQRNVRVGENIALSCRRGRPGHSLALFADGKTRKKPKFSHLQGKVGFYRVGVENW